MDLLSELIFLDWLIILFIAAFVGGMVWVSITDSRKKEEFYRRNSRAVEIPEARQMELGQRARGWYHPSGIYGWGLALQVEDSSEKSGWRTIREFCVLEIANTYPPTYEDYINSELDKIITYELDLRKRRASRQDFINNK